MTQQTQSGITSAQSPTTPPERVHAIPTWAQPMRALLGREWIALGLVLATLWELAGQFAGLSYLPSLSGTLSTCIGLFVDGTIPEVLLVSLISLTLGAGTATVVGVLLGAAMAQWRLVDRVASPYINAINSTPKIALVPLFIVLFGIGYPTRVVIVVLFALPPIVINTYAGLRAVDPSLLEMGRSFGASGWKLYGKVRLPAAAGLVNSGLQLGGIRAVGGVINGEVLISVVGLGGLAHQYGAEFAMERLWSIVMVTVAMAFLTVAVLGALMWIAFGAAASKESAS